MRALTAVLALAALLPGCSVRSIAVNKIGRAARID